MVLFDAYPRTDGGAQRWTRCVAAALRERGWEAVVAFPEHGPASEKAAELGVPVSIVQAPAALCHYGRTTRGRHALAAAAILPLYWRKAAAEWRRFDLVHVNDHRGLLLAGPAARLARRPLVWHVHSSLDARFLNALGPRLAQRVAAASAAPRDSLPGWPARSRDPVVLPMAIAPRLFDRPSPQPSPPPVIVSTARLHPVKGLDTLMEASAILRDQGLEHRVRIIGGQQEGHEQYASDLRTLRDRLALGEVVDLLGEQPRPDDFYSDATVYAQPSNLEQGALAALEAMACGLPVVASRVGGLPHAVVDGRTGRLVDPGNPGDLAAALLAVISDPTLARTWGKEGRTVASTWTIESLASRVEELYEDLLLGR